MSALRKTSFLLALVLMVLAFTSNANAQYALGTVTCSVSANPSTIRSEGVAELVGDINLSCTNAPGSNTTVKQFLTLNFTATISGGAVTNTQDVVTGSSTTDTAMLHTEAVLIVNSNDSATPTITSDKTKGSDSRFPGPQYMYLATQTGSVLNADGVLFPVPGSPNVATTTSGNATTGCTSYTDAASDGCFPTTTTVRITNIRASALDGGSITAVVAASGDSDFGGITGGTVTLSSSASGLTTAVTAATTTGLQCEAGSLTATLAVSEGFAASFKTVGVPTYNSNNTESGYFSPGSGAGTTGGGAVKGTQIKVTFGAVPTGVTVSVPVSVNNSTTDGSADCSAASNWNSDALCLHLLTAAGAATTYSATDATATIASNTGSVVYEVMDANPWAKESINVPVDYSWSAQSSSTTIAEAIGTTTLTATFNPVATVFTGDGGTTPSAIPRFSDSGATAADAATIGRCSTTLLFPWVLNTSGFDTGIVISNTSKDGLSTVHSQGICTVNWYGTTAPAAATTSSVIAAGGQYLFLVSTDAPGFQGYIIATCEFQYAHGFAYITNGYGGVNTQAQGYLALVLPSATRSVVEALNN